MNSVLENKYQRRSFAVCLAASAFIASTTCSASVKGSEDAFAFELDQFSKTASALQAEAPLIDGRLNTSAIASLDSSAENFVRLESTLSVEIDRSRSLRIGDTISNPGSLGSAVRFAGVQIGTPFAQRSDLLLANRQALAGVAIVPTSVDAILSGRRAAVGQFSDRGLSLRRAPQSTRANLSFATQDTLGRANTFTPTLLPKFSRSMDGCNTFSVGVGRARVDYALASNRYGPLFANSTLVCALGSGVAVEAHGAYLAGENGLAGVTLFRPLSALATASLAVATSENDRGSGWLVRLGLEHGNERFDVNLRARLQSDEFREMGEAIGGDSVAQGIVASAGARLTERSSISVAYINQVTYGAQKTSAMAVTQSLDLGSRGAVSIVANQSVDADSATVTLSYSTKFTK